MKIFIESNILTSVNPTGGVFVDYNPNSRMISKLAPNITTYNITAEIPPNTAVTIYRGIDKKVAQTKINPGDYVTTNYQLPKDYSGNGNVITLKVRADELLDDIDEPCGEEYIYRPNNNGIH